MVRLEISIRSILLLGGLLIALWLLTRVWPVLLLIAVSAMLAAAIFPLVEWMVGKNLRRGFAVTLVSLLLLAVMALIGFVIVPAVINQGQAFVEHVPDIRADLVSFLMRHHQPDMAARVSNVDVGELLKPEQIATTGRYVINVIYSTVTVLVLTVYFLLDARRAERFVFYMVPDEWHMHVHRLFFELRRTVGGYVRGQLITSGLITIYTTVVLEILGIPNALALGVLAGIGDMIPMVGGIIGILPATLFALSISLPQAIIVAALLTAYEEFEVRILVPRVYGGALRLPAVVVFIALLMGAEVAGLAGALLAVPIAAVLRGAIEYAREVRSGNVPPMDEQPPEPPPAGAPPAPAATEEKPAEPEEAVPVSGERHRGSP